PRPTTSTRSICPIRSHRSCAGWSTASTPTSRSSGAKSSATARRTNKDSKKQKVRGLSAFSALCVGILHPQVILHITILDRVIRCLRGLTPPLERQPETTVREVGHFTFPFQDFQLSLPDLQIIFLPRLRLFPICLRNIEEQAVLCCLERHHRQHLPVDPLAQCAGCGIHRFARALQIDQRRLGRLFGFFCRRPEVICKKTYHDNGGNPDGGFPNLLS